VNLCESANIIEVLTGYLVVLNNIEEECMKKSTLLFICLALLTISVVYGGGKADSTPASGGASAGSASTAWAPDRDFTIRIAFAAGGAFDTAARIVGQGLQKAYNKTVIVKNITGANGSVAAADLLSVEPNAAEMMGGGIAMFTLTPLFNTNFAMKLSDYRIVSGMLSEDFILCVNTSKSGLKSWEELAAYGKTNRVISACNAPGGTTHMLATGLFGGANIQFDALVAEGSAKNLLQLLAGESTCTIAPASAVSQYVKADGDITPILVFSDDPYTGYPGFTVPTAKSKGYDIIFQSSNFLMTRADVPQAHVDALYKTIQDYYQTAEFKELAEKAHFVPDTSDGESVRKTIENAADFCKRMYDKYYKK
jgi:tripartite-type tricarboxylate transporter receptor subunit TctC